MKTQEKLIQQEEQLPINQEITGSELYRYTLEMLNVEKIGVYTGGRVIDLLDKLGQSKEIKLITGPHEQDLGHAFQAYFKVSRKPGFLIVTSGPGGTNSSTPVKDAQSDSDAIILTIGQVPLESIKDGEESFQGAPMIEPFKYWTKWSYRIKSADEIQSVLKTAYFISTEGRPGPVVLELPSPIAQFQKAKLKPIDEVQLIDIENNNIPNVYNEIRIRKSNLNELIKSIEKSKRPITVAGGGIYNAGAMKELLQFSILTDIPFTTTLILIGAMPKHKLNLGLPGMHGFPENNLAIYNSDLVIYIGARLDDRIILDPEKFAPNAEIFWIEPNNPGIGNKIANRVKKVEVDAKESLRYLIANLKQIKHEEWLEQILSWRKKYPMPKHVPRTVIEQIRKFVDIYEENEPYLTTGVGAHQMFLAEFWNFNPDSNKKMLLTSGGLGTMGTGTPFAIGALLADPERSVYVFNGDGSLVMDQRSLLLAYQLKKCNLIGKNSFVKEIVFRDNSLSMVDHWQDQFWNSNKTASDLDLPLKYFENMASQNEFKYFLVDYLNGNSDNNISVIENFVKHRGNALLEVRMFPEPVLPMIPSMKSIDKMRLPNGNILDKEDLLIGKNN